MFGVGIDVIEVSRIAHAMEDPGFVAHVLTDQERSLNPDAERLAGVWAAKEAVAKAVGVHLKWHDVEIGEASTARIVPGAATDGLSIRISISVSGGMAVAVAIAERLDE